MIVHAEETITLIVHIEQQGYFFFNGGKGIGLDLDCNGNRVDR
jgi:hypothetical protein